MTTLMPVVRIKGAAPVRYDLDARMRRYKAPGVSVAVADGGRVVWARGFGVKVAGAADPVTETTLFAAASISKPIAATATLRLVDEGRVSLDEDVNTYLRSWKVPGNDFTATEKVTLRRLLSHTAGTNVHGFMSYPGQSPLPTLIQVLDGAKPANTAPVRVEAVPGSAFRYSGGGVTIEQLALIEVTGEPFPALLDELVLDPLGMKDSFFAAEVPAARRSRLATAHDLGGAPIPDVRRPEMAADGLWTTPTDLLRWAIAIADARAGRSSRVLSKASATAMLAKQKGPVGLGPFVAGTGRSLRFGHEGSDQGYHAELVYFPETGQGAVVMTNGDGARPLLREILYAIADERGWPDFAPVTVEAQALSAASLDRVVGTYQARIEGWVLTASVTRRDAQLFIDVPLLGVSSPVVFTSPTAMSVIDSGDELSTVADAGGQVTALRFGDLTVPRRP